LKANEVALEMVRYRHFDHDFTDSIVYASLYLTEKTKKRPDYFLIQNGHDIETNYFQFYKNAITYEMEDPYSYENFWKPIADAVGTTSTIYLSADGVYNQINLEAIPLGDEKYVLDNSNIILVSNTKDLYLRSQRKKDDKKANDALMFGNPTFYAKGGGSGQIQQLPGTEKEINQLQGMLATNGWSADEYLEAEATEDRVKEINSPKVFHIATHGFFQSDEDFSRGANEMTQSEAQAAQNPLLRTGLLLKGAGDILDASSYNYNMESGILTAYEAMNLNLDQTDLVVLSACETGLGDVQAGEGVFGLQRAFLVAGAKTLIMSIFKVNDAATQELMVTFYKKWLATGKKRESFVEAKKELRNNPEFAAPKYWGAFLMLGLD
jgi:CHAT domain-containing protein